MTENNDPAGPEGTRDESDNDFSTIACPLCGAKTFQEKCKVICKSEICRGRVIMNCAEF